MVVEPGEYKVEAGGSSANLPLSASITLSGEWDAKLAAVCAVADKYVYEVGDTGKASVTATLEDTSRICLHCAKPVFSSSNEAVASVDEKGGITAKASGTALITATVSYKGVSKSAKVPVAVK
jgi:beta-glucosidase